MNRILGDVERGADQDERRKSGERSVDVAVLDISGSEMYDVGQAAPISCSSATTLIQLQVGLRS